MFLLKFLLKVFGLGFLCGAARCQRLALSEQEREAQRARFRRFRRKLGEALEELLPSQPEPGTGAASGPGAQAGNPEAEAR